MSYSEELAARCRRLLAGEPGITERKMFGGLSFLLHGNMIGGVLGGRLVVRIGKDEAYTRALRTEHVEPMDFTGRPLRGFVYVDPPGLAGAGLRTWIRQALAFGKTLPKKIRSATAGRGKRKTVGRRKPHARRGMA